MRTVALIFVVLNCALLCLSASYSVTFSFPGGTLSGRVTGGGTATYTYPSMSGTGTLVITSTTAVSGTGSNTYYQINAASSSATITLSGGASRTDCNFFTLPAGTASAYNVDAQLFQAASWAYAAPGSAVGPYISYNNLFGPTNPATNLLDDSGLGIVCGTVAAAGAGPGTSGSNDFAFAWYHSSTQIIGIAAARNSNQGHVTTEQTAATFTLTPTSGTVQSDPIVRGFDGVEFDFKGLPNRVFNMFSISDLQISSHLVPTNKAGETYTSAIGVRQAGASSVLFDLNGAYVFPENVTSSQKHLAKYIPFPMAAPLKLANGGVVTRPSAGKLNIDFPSYSIHMVRIYEQHDGVEVDYLDFSLSMSASLNPTAVGGVLGQTYRNNSTVRNTNPADFIAVEATPFDVFTNEFPAASFKYTAASANHVAGDVEKANTKHKN